MRDVIVELMVGRISQSNSKCIVLPISHVNGVKGEDVQVIFAYDELVQHLFVIDSPKRFHLRLVTAWKSHDWLAVSEKIHLVTVLHIVRDKVDNRNVGCEWISGTVHRHWVEVHILGADNIVSICRDNHCVVATGWEEQPKLIDSCSVVDNLASIHKLEIGHKIIINWNLSSPIGIQICIWPYWGPNSDILEGSIHGLIVVVLVSKDHLVSGGLDVVRVPLINIQYVDWEFLGQHRILEVLVWHALIQVVRDYLSSHIPSAVVRTSDMVPFVICQNLNSSVIEHSFRDRLPAKRSTCQLSILNVHGEVLLVIEHTMKSEQDSLIFRRNLLNIWSEPELHCEFIRDFHCYILLEVCHRSIKIVLVWDWIGAHCLIPMAILCLNHFVCEIWLKNLVKRESIILPHPSLTLWRGYIERVWYAWRCPSLKGLVIFVVLHREI